MIDPDDQPDYFMHALALIGVSMAVVGFAGLMSALMSS